MLRLAYVSGRRSLRLTGGPASTWLRRPDVVISRHFSAGSTASPPAAAASVPSTASSGATTAEDGSGEKKKEDSSENEGGGIPWGLFAVLGFVGAIAGYFYRGRRNQNTIKKLQDGMQDSAALSGEEVEEIRDSNRLTPTHFNLLSSAARARFPSGKARPSEFFDFCASFVHPDSKQLAAKHLIERLAARLEEQQPIMDTSVLLTAMTMAVDSPLEDRMSMLFRLAAGGRKDAEKLTQEQLVQIVSALMITNQMPVRCLSREFNEYPFNRYDRSTPEFVITRGVEELYKNRKKLKILEGHEEELVKLLKQDLAGRDEEAKAERKAALEASKGSDGKVAQAEETKVKNDSDKIEGAAVELPTEPIWSLEDFTDLLYTRAICAWGECHTKK